MLKPDISWWSGKHCVFVGDAKYKRIRNESSPNEDLYQLLAYTVATGLPAGLLIYAEGEDVPRVVHVDAVEKSIEIASVRLSGEPDEVLASLAAVADLVRAMAVEGVGLAPVG